jgi:nitrite reductase/ring-hydroxylating ferredoxin subunit
MDTQELRSAIDTDTAYGRQLGHHDAALTEVAPGTPMGELLRRYWHPVALATDATNVPREIRVLGEDLILFRDGGGRPGLVHARCAHRGTTLYYGKVEERGIRCCYHGWLFDVEGRCLDQPCEPGGGLHKDKVRQPWYPVEERYGLVFAYMGPPEKQPPLPRYETLEVLRPGEMVEAAANCAATGGPFIVPCNWLQHWENVMDSFHVPILHGTFSGTQFTEIMTMIPEVSWAYSPHGIRSQQVRTLPDGTVMRRITEIAVPTLRLVPNPFANAASQFDRVETITWTLPIDDTHFRLYSAGRVTEKGRFKRNAEGAGLLANYNWAAMTPKERQARPGDYEAQTGQGPITLHSEEHLVASDTGVAMARRVLQQQLDALAAGRDPINVAVDPAAPLVEFQAGNYVLGEGPP